MGTSTFDFGKHSEKRNELLEKWVVYTCTMDVEPVAGMVLLVHKYSVCYTHTLLCPTLYVLDFWEYAHPVMRCMHENQNS